MTSDSDLLFNRYYSETHFRTN